MIDNIVIDLTNWSRKMPMGIAAHNHDGVPQSTYMDGIEDCKAFFEENKADISYCTTLDFAISSNDIEHINDGISKYMFEVRELYMKILRG